MGGSAGTTHCSSGEGVGDAGEARWSQSSPTGRSKARLVTCGLQGRGRGKGAWCSVVTSEG